MGAVVYNRDAPRCVQAFLEFCEENDSPEQSRHCYWNFDRGSCDEISGGWKSVGDDGADGDECGGGGFTLVRVKESQELKLNRANSALDILIVGAAD